MQAQLITTVTAAASTYDLTTLAVIKDELNITDNASDTKLQRYLTSASAAIAQFCNRVFPAETITDEFWAQSSDRLFCDGPAVLQLSKWPIVSVTSVTENGSALVSGTDFRLDAKNGQLVRLNSNGYPRAWPVYPVAVVYVGGYTPIPSDLADAAIRMVRIRWNSKDRDPLVKQRSIPGVLEEAFWVATGADAGNFPPDVADILSNYRVPALAA